MLHQFRSIPTSLVVPRLSTRTPTTHVSHSCIAWCCHGKRSLNLWLCCLSQPKFFALRTGAGLEGHQARVCYHDARSVTRQRHLRHCKVATPAEYPHLVSATHSIQANPAPAPVTTSTARPTSTQLSCACDRRLCGLTWQHPPTAAPWPLAHLSALPAAACSAEQVLLYSMDAEQRAALDKRPSGESSVALPIGCCSEVSCLAFSELEAAPTDRAALRGVLLAAVGGNGSAMVWRPSDKSIVASFRHLHQVPSGAGQQCRECASLITIPEHVAPCGST